MDVIGIVIWGAFIWALLIVGWWGFWLWYGRGELHPTSWRAILTLPIWSVQSIRHGRRVQRARAEVATLKAQRDDSLAQIRAELHLIRLAPPRHTQVRRRVACQLEEALRDAPLELPSDIRTDMEETIRALRRGSA